MAHAARISGFLRASFLLAWSEWMIVNLVVGSAHTSSRFAWTGIYVLFIRSLTSAWRKQVATWSLTMPTACMKA